MSKENLFIEVNKCLRYLDNAGWSDLIDSRWEDDVVKELKHNFPNVSDEVITTPASSLPPNKQFFLVVVTYCHESVNVTVVSPVLLPLEPILPVIVLPSAYFPFTQKLIVNVFPVYNIFAFSIIWYTDMPV